MKKWEPCSFRFTVSDYCHNTSIPTRKASPRILLRENSHFLSCMRYTLINRIMRFSVCFPFNAPLVLYIYRVHCRDTATTPENTHVEEESDSLHGGTKQIFRIYFICSSNDAETCRRGIAEIRWEPTVREAVGYASNMNTILHNSNTDYATLQCNYRMLFVLQSPQRVDHKVEQITHAEKWTPTWKSWQRVTAGSATCVQTRFFTRRTDDSVLLRIFIHNLYRDMAGQWILNKKDPALHEEKLSNNIARWTDKAPTCISSPVSGRSCTFLPDHRAYRCSWGHCEWWAGM